MSVSDIVERIVRLVEEEENFEEAKKILESMPPEDAVEVLLRLSNSVRMGLLAVIDLEKFVDVLARLPTEVVHEIARAKGVDDISRVVAKMPVDEAADFLSKIPAKVRTEVLKLLPNDFEKQVVELMKYPPESVGGIMTTMVPVFPGNITVEEAINQYFEKAKTGAYEPHNYIYVVDSSGRLIGYVEPRTLLLKPRNIKLTEIAHPVKAVVNANADREEAARIAIRYDLIEVPVVDDQGRFLGIVTLDDLLDVITSEYQEDLLKYAGIAEAIKGSYVTEKPWRLAIRRIPAIIALYLMDTVTGGIVASFTNIIERVAVLAAFMPILADNSGNIGAQSSAIIIRGLVTGELRISRRDMLLILRKEFATTMLMLSILAPVGFAIGLLIPFITTLNLGYSLKIATTVTLALIVSCYVADLVGAFLPLLLAKLRIDPATASAPLITTIADISTVLTYFTTASILLGAA